MLHYHRSLLLFDEFNDLANKLLWVILKQQQACGQNTFQYPDHSPSSQRSTTSNITHQVVWHSWCWHLTHRLSACCLFASEVQIILALFTRRHHIFHLGNSQVFVDGSDGFLDEFLAIIVNGIDIAVIDFSPQTFKLILCSIVVQFFIHNLSLIVSILYHTFQSWWVEDTLYQFVHLFADRLQFLAEWCQRTLLHIFMILRQDVSLCICIIIIKGSLLTADGITLRSHHKGLTLEVRYCSHSRTFT